MILVALALIAALVLGTYRARRLLERAAELELDD